MYRCHGSICMDRSASSVLTWPSVARSTSIVIFFIFFLSVLAKHSILLSEARRQLFTGRPGLNLYLTLDPLDDASDYTISIPADQGSSLTLDPRSINGTGATRIVNGSGLKFRIILNKHLYNRYAHVHIELYILLYLSPVSCIFYHTH